MSGAEEASGRAGEDLEERFRKIVEDRFSRAPFYDLIGLSIESLSKGEARLSLKAGAHLHNTIGIVHGGAIASLADASSGVAMATLVPGGSRRVITIEQKVNFIAPAREGKLLGIGRVIWMDNDIAVSESEIRDEEGSLVAKSIATHTLLPFFRPGR